MTGWLAGWLRTAEKEHIACWFRDRAVFCLGSTLDNKGSAVLRNVGRNSAAETSHHVPESAVLSYTPLRISTVHYFCVLSSLLLNQPSSWKTTPCRLSGTVCGTYSRLPFIPAGRLLGTRYSSVKVTQYGVVVVVDVAASKWPVVLAFPSA